MTLDDEIDAVIESLDDALLEQRWHDANILLRGLASTATPLAVLVAALTATHKAQERLSLYGWVYGFTRHLARVRGVDAAATLMGLEPTGET